MCVCVCVHVFLGQETSANILTFAVSELGKHPKVLTK